MENNRKEDIRALKGEKLFSVTLTAAVLAVIIIINVLIYVLNSTLGIFYIVPKADGDTAITAAMDAKFADAQNKGAKVKISFCMAKDEIELDTVGKRVHETAMKFRDKYPELIELDYINALVEKPKLQKFIDAGNEIRKNTVIIENGENFKVFTDINTSLGFVDFFTTTIEGDEVSYEGETMFAGMICWVLTPDHPKAYLTEGHSEQIDPAFSLVLTAAGYDVEIINISKKDIPEDCDLLIISTPKNDFETASADSEIEYAVTEIGRLEAYLKRGGNLYVSLDPYISGLTSLAGVLKSCGISVSGHDGNANETHIVRDDEMSVPGNLYSIITKHSDGQMATEISNKVKAYNNGNVILRYAGALNLDKGAEPLLEASESARLMKGTDVVDESGSYAVAAYNKLTLDGGTQPATVFVNSSIYLTVTSALVTNGYSNRDFVYAVFENLYGAGAMPYGCTSDLYDNQTLENLTSGAARIYTILALAVPVSLAALGAFVVIRRKNR